MQLQSEKPDVTQVFLSPALILEDDPALQLRLTHLLCQSGVLAADIHVAGSLAAAVSVLQSQQISFALIDIVLPDGNGIDFIRHLQQEYPQIQGLIISTWGTEDLILSALRAGAIGYLLKEREDEELTSALRSIERGGSPIDPFIARRILSHALKNAPVSKESPDVVAPSLNHSENPSKLSCREIEILQFVAKGLSNREIADTLHLSRLTIECHIKNTYRKLEVISRTQAIHQARQYGLLSGL